jgi:hypothetical protein
MSSAINTEKMIRIPFFTKALCLGQKIGVVILDHHLMRSEEGAGWLDEPVAKDRIDCFDLS